MNQPVSYVELNTPNLETTSRFLADAFGWEWQPFTIPEYLVAPRGDSPGVDTGVMPSRDGQARAIPVIRVEDLDTTIARVREAGGTLVVEPFNVPGIGWGCYITDPTGLLIGLHCYNDVPAQGAP